MAKRKRTKESKHSDEAEDKALFKKLMRGKPGKSSAKRARK